MISREAQEIVKEMSLSWPSAHDDESKIIEQFKFIREHLTKESGEKFCAASPGCGFLMELYDAGHLHYEGAFQSYLSCLRTLVPLVARSNFLCMFVKNCSGCAALQFLSIVYLHPILENEVNCLFRELLCDSHGDILHRNDIRQLALTIRLVYKRQDFPFPYMASCCDFDWENEGFKIAKAIGELFCSDKFLELMKRDSTVGAQIAHELFKTIEEKDKEYNHLQTLIAKYQESTSENELDT